jgi:hypothetical protein
VKHLLLDKLVFAFAAQFKQARTNNISTNGNVVREKATHITVHL